MPKRTTRDATGKIIDCLPEGDIGAFQIGEQNTRGLFPLTAFRWAAKRPDYEPLHFPGICAMLNETLAIHLAKQLLNACGRKDLASHLPEYTPWWRAGKDDRNGTNEENEGEEAEENEEPRA